MVNKRRIMLVLAGGVLAISTSAILIRSANAAPSVLAFYRLFFASLFFAPMAVRQNRKERLQKQQLILGFVAGILLALHFLLWITSLEYTSVTSSVVLVTTHPLWVFLFSILFLQEKPSPMMWSGLFIALLGTCVVAFSQAGVENQRLWGDLLAIGGAITLAGSLIVGRKLRQELPLALYSTVVFGSASFVLALFMLLTNQPWLGYDGKTWLIFVALALFPTILGHNTLNWALKYLPATIVSAATLGEPLAASILAIIFLGETPVLFEVLGSIITLAGIFLILVSENNKKIFR